MNTTEKIADLLARNFLLMADWQAEDRQLVDLDADGNVTVSDSDGTSRLVSLHEVTDIGFASRLVPDRYLPIADYDTDLESRFAVFCQLTDLTDETVSALIGRPVGLNELREPNDWKAICAGLIGL
jgi:hypothetical protein